ncbi:MAG: methylamine utilization protein [Arenimonas sp.]
MFPDSFVTGSPPRAARWWRALAAGLAGLAFAPAIDASASAALEAMVVDAKGGSVADAVVSLHPLPGTALPPAGPVRPQVMDQRGLRFVPHVLAVATGTPVSFPNSDRVRHHVYSFSPAKRFELRLYAGRSQLPVVFDAPGLVTLGCNIHDWMLGFIYVVDSPWFAVSDAEGKARVPAAPGSYEARIWHPLIEGGEPRGMGRVTLGDGGGRERYAVALRPAERIFEPPTELEDKFSRFRK